LGLAALALHHLEVFAMLLDVFFYGLKWTFVTRLARLNSRLFKCRLRFLEVALMVVGRFYPDFFAHKKDVVLLLLRHLVHGVVYDEALGEAEIKRIEQLFVKFLPVGHLQHCRILGHDWDKLHQLLPRNLFIWVGLRTKRDEVKLARNLLGTNLWIIKPGFTKNSENFLFVQELLTAGEEKVGQLRKKLFLCNRGLETESVLSGRLEHTGFTGCTRAPRPGTYHVVVDGECRLDVTLDPILEALKVTRELPIEDLLYKRLPALVLGAYDLSWEEGQISVRKGK
jgi:hypothetical protein